jgi:hypothetical protein
MLPAFWGIKGFTRMIFIAVAFVRQRERGDHSPIWEIGEPLKWALDEEPDEASE